jgi:hypothetical protein
MFREPAAGVNYSAVAVDVYLPDGVQDRDSFEPLPEDDVRHAIVRGAVFLCHVRGVDIGVTQTPGVRL